MDIKRLFLKARVMIFAVLITLVICIVLFLSHFSLISTNPNNTSNFLSPNQLSLLLLGDPLYSYYNGSGIIMQIHQAPIRNGSVYQFIYSNGSIARTVIGAINGNYLNYITYNPNGRLSDKVVTQSNCTRWATPNGGWGNYTYIVHICSQPNRNTVDKYSQSGILENTATTNTSNFSAIIGINHLLQVPTNDSYTTIQYFFTNGTLFRTMYSRFSCQPEANATVVKKHENITQICNTTDAYYRPASAVSNSTKLNFTHNYKLNPSLNSFVSSFVYETVQNLTNGGNVANFYSRYVNESVFNNPDNSVTYRFNTTYINETIKNFVFNNTETYRICFPQECISEYVKYNETIGVLYSNGSVDAHPTNTQISEAYNMLDGMVGTYPIYSPFYGNFLVSSSNKNGSDANCSIGFSNSTMPNLVSNIDFTCGNFSSSLNIGSDSTSNLFIWNSTKTPKYSILDLEYSVGPNQNQVFITYEINGINEMITQSYGAGSFGDQIELSVSNPNGTKETESQHFPIKTTGPSYKSSNFSTTNNTYTSNSTVVGKSTTIPILVTFIESGLPKGYNWNLTYNGMLYNTTNNLIKINNSGYGSIDFYPIYENLSKCFFDYLPNVTYLNANNLKAVNYINFSKEGYCLQYEPGMLTTQIIIKGWTETGYDAFLSAAFGGRYWGLSAEYGGTRTNNGIEFFTTAGNFSWGVPWSVGNLNRCTSIQVPNSTIGLFDTGYITGGATKIVYYSQTMICPEINGNPHNLDLFHESGLPEGAKWNMFFGGESGSSSSDIIAFPNNYNSSTNSEIGGIKYFALTYCPNESSNTILGSSLFESYTAISFAPGTCSILPPSNTNSTKNSTTIQNSSSSKKNVIIFSETGVPAGYNWSVSYAGETKYLTSTSSSLSFNTSTTASNATASILGLSCTSTLYNIQQSGNYTFSNFQCQTVFVDYGLASGYSLNITYDNLTEIYTNTKSNRTFETGTGIFDFSISLSYNSNLEPNCLLSVHNGTLVAGHVISLSLSSSCGAIFTESGLPLGTNWSATYNGIRKFSTNKTITFHEAGIGVYNYSIQNTTKISNDAVGCYVAYYSPNISNGKLASNQSISISFSSNELCNTEFNRGALPSDYAINITMTWQWGTSAPWNGYKDVSKILYVGDNSTVISSKSGTSGSDTLDYGITAYPLNQANPLDCYSIGSVSAGSNVTLNWTCVTTFTETGLILESSTTWDVIYDGQTKSSSSYIIRFYTGLSNYVFPSTYPEFSIGPVTVCGSGCETYYSSPSNEYLYPGESQNVNFSLS